MTLLALIVDDEAPARGELRHLLTGIDGIEVAGEAANGSGGDPGPSQAAHLSQIAALTVPGGGVSALQELTGFLTRCLGQQAEVRAALYAGVPAVVAADAQAADPLADMLLAQMERVAGGSRGPLDLGAAVGARDDARAAEPLARLLACVRMVVLLAGPRKDDGAPYGGEAERQAAGLGGRGALDPSGPAACLAAAYAAAKDATLRSVAEDYGLDKSSDFGESAEAREGVWERGRKGFGGLREWGAAGRGGTRHPSRIHCHHYHSPTSRARRTGTGRPPCWPAWSTLWRTA